MERTTETTKEPFAELIKSGPYQIRFPKAGQYDQDEEWCEVEVDGAWRRIRFHDYAAVYQVPGLYETIFYRTLQCVSPTVVAGLFKDVCQARGVDPKNLRALDFGAGNGMAGEALQTLGVRKIVGADILETARDAALRDRPWVYIDYLVQDFTDLAPDDLSHLQEFHFNLLTTVAALGYGDIPARAFFNAYNLVEDQGWVAFNIKEDFLKGSERKGFAGLVNMMIEKDALQIEMYKRYRHRLSIKGEPLFYITLVGRKLSSIPEELLSLT